MDAPDLLAGRTPKLRVGGGYRSCEPSETWQNLQPLLREWGITRVGNITGLDRVGIPVWMAVRPNSRSLAVSQGKGISDDSARVSAAMEALELAHAERPPSDLRYACVEALRGESPLADPARLPVVRRSLHASARPVLWTKGFDLATGTRCWLPYEMVYADATLPRMPGSGAFLASTNGLASGNSLLEAVVHGLCEVIERDAIALWDALDDEARHATRLEPNGCDADEAAGPILERLRQAGLTVLAWNATTDVGVPVVRCIVFDGEPGVELRPIPAAFGAGCHLDRGIALVRALTEAAQSRLTVIAGARDDFDRQRYRTTQHRVAFEHHRALARRPGVQRLADLSSTNTETLEDDLAHLLAHVQAVGAGPVLVRDLSVPGMPIAVARVIVPGLEGPSESGAYTPGPRARAAAGLRDPA